ncbi:MAG: mechanosensitive ion channel family protein [Psychroflexus halocasei]
MLYQDISSLQDRTRYLLEGYGLAENSSNFLAVVINSFALFIASWLFSLVIRTIIRALVKPWLKKKKNDRTSIFIKKRVFDALAKLMTGFVVYYLLPLFFNISAAATHNLRILAVIYIIIMAMVFLTRTFHSLEYLGQHSKKYEKKPVSSYIQVMLIICYLISAVLIISILFGKSPMTIITAFGAGMAIVLLIFKDVILGLVASIQVSVNDMVRVGDWISIYNYDADGQVTEINLTSVKVRNWDNTISNVPTYALVSNGFKNVRAMEDTNIRRIMHHLLIDLRSIKKVDNDFIKNLRAKGLFSGESEKLKWNDEKGYDFEKLSTITNLSLFRQYIESFLMMHPGINNEYMVVRQLQQDGNGLPLEIYAWVNSVSFKPLNLIQSDVFEHLITIIGDFDLVLFQKPSGNDIQGIKGTSLDQLQKR